MKVALILPGGGAAGVFEVGVMQELFKHITPDIFIATSAGALTFGGILAGEGEFWKDLQEGAVISENVWKSLATKKQIIIDGRKWGVKGGIFSINPLAVISPFFASTLFNPKKIKELIYNLVGDKKFEDVKRPFYVGAINLLEGKTVFFNKGKLSDALIASCAAVPFYPPHTIDGSMFIDGGLDIGACISKASELGADKIILINMIRGTVKRNDMFNLLRQTTNIVMGQHMKYFINNGFSDKILELTSLEPIAQEFHDLSSVAKVVEIGRASARKFVKDNASELPFID